MSIWKAFNPVWRKARAIVKLITGNPAIALALQQLEDAIFAALLSAVLTEAQRRGIGVDK